MRFVLIMILLSEWTYSQPPTIQWQKSYGGSQNDIFNSILIDNNEFVIIGNTESNDSGVVGHHDAVGIFTPDVWLTKIDSNGILRWNKCYGGESDEYGYSVCKTVFGNYIVAADAGGHDDGDVSGIHNHSDDFWIININDSGAIIWAKCYGGVGEEFTSTIIQTLDSNYFIVGYENSNDHDITGNHGDFDIWILKIDRIGNIIWSNPIGGTFEDRPSGYQSIYQESNGNVRVLGITESTNGIFSSNHGGTDLLVFEIDTAGNLLSQKLFGGTQLDDGWAILPGHNSYFIAGLAGSNDGDISNYHGGGDVWLAKVDTANNIIWNNCYGGTDFEQANSMCDAGDGGLVLAGYCYSNSGQVTGTHGNKDIWVIKVDSLGNFEWGKALGGTSDDEAKCIKQTPDGGYLVAGYTSSNNGDVSVNMGNQDAWLVKLSPPGMEIKSPENDLMDLTVLQDGQMITVRFFSRTNENIRLNVYDTEGRVVKNISVNVNVGINYINENFTEQPGSYFLRIQGNHSFLTNKFLWK